MVNLKKELIKSHVILTQKDWQNFKPLLAKNHISFESSGYGENVYIAFNVDQKTHNLIDKLLMQI